MALGIGNERLEAVRRALLRVGGVDLKNRIEVRRARVGKVEREMGSVVLTPKVREVQDSEG